MSIFLDFFCVKYEAIIIFIEEKGGYRVIPCFKVSFINI